MDALDRNSTCRACMNNNAVLNIFTFHILNKADLEYCCEVMAEMFLVSADKEDGLPFKICRKCYDELSSAYRFKQIVEKSFRQLFLFSLDQVEPRMNDIVKERKSSVLGDNSDGDTYEGETEIDNFQMNPIEDTELSTYLKQEERDSNVLDILPNSGIDENCDMKPIEIPMANIKPEKTAKNQKRKRKTHFICDHCQKVLATKDTLKSHLRIHSGEKPFLCPKCGARFRQGCHLITHMKSHNRIKNPLTVRTYTKRTEKSGIEKPKTEACRFCPKMFQSKVGVILHERTHTGEKPFICEYCSKRFAQKSTLICHRRTHTGERPYCCNICFKRFTEHSALNLHKNVHTGGEVFACEFCTTAFPSKCNLIRHKRTHTECKKKFEKLIAGKEEESTDLAFSCKVCDKKFSEGSDLENHVRNHKRKYFSCEECNIKFSKKNRLNLHMMSSHMPPQTDISLKENVISC